MKGRLALCVDIGGTRIKSAVIPQHMDLRMLRDLPIASQSSAAWLNERLPDLFLPENLSSFIPEGLDIDSVLHDIRRVCISGPFYPRADRKTLEEDGWYHTELGMPLDLGQRIQDSTGLPVSILNDGEAWLRGMFRYLCLSGLSPAPGQVIAVLALGTGIALGVTDDFSDAGFRDGVVDLWDMDVRELPRVQEWCNKRSLKLKNIQDLTDSHFLSPLLSEREANNRLLIALLRDLAGLGLLPLSRLHTLMIGGGKSRFVDLYRIGMELGLSVAAGGDYVILEGTHLIKIIQ